MNLSSVMKVVYVAYWIFLFTVVLNYEHRITRLEDENKELRNECQLVRKGLDGTMEDVHELYMRGGSDSGFSGDFAGQNDIPKMAFDASREVPKMKSGSGSKCESKCESKHGKKGALG